MKKYNVHSLMEGLLPKMLKTADVGSVISWIKSVDPIEVIKYSEKYPRLSEICYELTEYWDNIFQEYGKAYGTKQQNFHTMNTLCSFDLICGMYHYNNFLIDDSRSELKLAIKYRNLQALLLKNSEYRSNLYSAKSVDADINLNKMIVTAADVAHYYGTIGFVTLAKTYAEIAIYHYHVTGNDEARWIALGAMENAFEKAKLSIEYSSDATHNANILLDQDVLTQLPLEYSLIVALERMFFRKEVASDYKSLLNLNFYRTQGAQVLSQQLNRFRSSCDTSGNTHINHPI